VKGSGVDLVLQAVSRLRTRLPTLRCHIIGEGPARVELEDLAGHLKLGRTVRFTGTLPKEVLPAFYAAADLFLLPRLCDTFGCADNLPLLQASAAGLPIIAADAGSAPEIVKEGENGLLVSGHDPDELADLSLLILTNPALSRTMGHRGRSVARAHDLVAMSERFLAICDGRL
jgi:phosphatidylinositol alpha-1,6-mannosyltransferase